VFKKHRTAKNENKSDDHKKSKISPVHQLTVDSLQLTFVPTSKSRDTKLGQISKIRPDQI